MESLRRENATSRAWAVLAVSHDCDGLLRLVPCRSVAPCNRSWGSPRFQCARSRSGGRALPRGPGASSSLTFPVAPYPSKPFPRHQLCAASPQPIPSRRYRRFKQPACWCCHLHTGSYYSSARPQGLVPMPSPLLSPGVATWRRLDASLGLFPSKRMFSAQRLAGPHGDFRLRALVLAGVPRDPCLLSSCAAGRLRLLACSTSEEVRARQGALACLALHGTAVVVPSSRVGSRHSACRSGMRSASQLGRFQTPAEAVAFLLPGGSLPGADRSRCLSASRWALR